MAESLHMNQEALKTRRAFKELCEILFPEQMNRINDAAPPNQPSKLSSKNFSINGHIGFYGLGNDLFVSGVQGFENEHKCWVIGTVRPDLMLEMVWERIFLSNERIIPHELDNRRLLVSIDGITFDITYRVLTPTLSFAEIEHWEKVQYYTETYPDFTLALRFLLRDWAESRGLLKTTLQPEGFTPTVISRMLMDVFGSAQNIRDGYLFLVKAFFETHSNPSAYWPGPSLVDWEFLRMHQRFDEHTFDTQHQDTSFLKRHLETKAMDSTWIGCQCLIEISVTTLSFSAKECGLAIERLEEVIRKAYMETFAFMNSGRSNIPESDRIYLRCWPYRLVLADASIQEIPYEGYYKLAIIHQQPGNSRDENKQQIKQIADMFTSKVINLMSSNKAVSVNAQIGASSKKKFKKCDRKWPLRIVSPPAEMQLKKLTSTISVTKKRAGEEPSEETVFLRPAIDILNRLRYDQKYNLDEFVVGYEDRHSGIMEKAAAEWTTEVSSDQFIPQSRIVYFRNTKTVAAENENDDGRVWDRRSKKDLVFGTGLETWMNRAGLTGWC